MDKQAVIRRVRIAVSVFFAIVAAWLCVMWVRSIYTIDQFIAPVSSENTPRLPRCRIGFVWALSTIVLQSPGHSCAFLWINGLQIFNFLRARCRPSCRNGSVQRPGKSYPNMVRGCRHSDSGCRSMGFVLSSLLPPHHAHRHDAGGRRAGAGSLAGFLGLPICYCAVRRMQATRLLPDANAENQRRQCDQNHRRRLGKNDIHPD